MIKLYRATISAIALILVAAQIPTAVSTFPSIPFQQTRPALVPNVVSHVDTAVIVGYLAGMGIASAFAFSC